MAWRAIARSATSWVRCVIALDYMNWTSAARTAAHKGPPHGKHSRRAALSGLPPTREYACGRSMLDGRHGTEYDHAAAWQMDGRSVKKQRGCDFRWLRRRQSRI